MEVCQLLLCAGHALHFFLMARFHRLGAIELGSWGHGGHGAGWKGWILVKTHAETCSKDRALKVRVKSL